MQQISAWLCWLYSFIFLGYNSRTHEWACKRITANTRRIIEAQRGMLMAYSLKNMQFNLMDWMSDDSPECFACVMRSVVYLLLQHGRNLSGQVRFCHQGFVRLSHLGLLKCYWYFCLNIFVVKKWMFVCIDNDDGEISYWELERSFYASTC